MKHSLITLTGWALALQFAGLYWSERQNHRPMVEGVAAQRSNPSMEGQLERIRTLLHRHQARQALVESSRTLAQCCALGVDVPDDLHQLLARSVEAMTPPPPDLQPPPPPPTHPPRQQPYPRARRPQPPGPRVSLALPECNYPQARPKMPGPPPRMEPPMEPPLGPPMSPGMSPEMPPEWQFPGQPPGGPHPWPPPAGPPPHPPGW